MKKTDLKNAKFLLVSRDPTRSSYSMEFIWKRTRSSITTIDVASFLEINYEIRTTKKGEVTFPNIPEVKLGEHHHLHGVQEWVTKRRRELTVQMNEKRAALEKAVTTTKEFEEFCEKLSEKLPYDFRS